MRVPLLNFVGGPGVPLLNFGGCPGLPILNFEGVPGSWSHFYTMPFSFGLTGDNFLDEKMNRYFLDLILGKRDRNCCTMKNHRCINFL